MAVRGECIAWRSESGLRNEGRLTFSPRQKRAGAPDGWRLPSLLKATSPMTSVTMVVRFNVSRPVAAMLHSGFVTSFMNKTLHADLARFRDLAMRNKQARLAMGLPPPKRAAPIVERAIQELQDQKTPPLRDLCSAFSLAQCLALPHGGLCPVDTGFHLMNASVFESRIRPFNSLFF